ncbi:MAG: histidine kinase [Maribacter sp.]|uniref:sensor histidine kinase n=1 Tax=Maribacter sp. TaxID=1897614 RepID=UPI0032981C95
MHHILFWAGYHFAWWTLYSGSISIVFESLTEPYGIVKFLGYVVFQALGVYFCLYYLIPNFLQKGKYLVFFFSTFGIIVIMAGVITANYYLAAFIGNASVYELFNISPETPATIFKNNAFSSCVAATTLGLSIKLTKNWIASEKRRNAAEKENLATELKFLRSQYNPHFLFNTINSIFVLIRKNQDMASDSLAKFSELLRYQLYQCNEPEIDLGQEVNYIKNYIELETLRQDLTKLDLQVALDSSNTNGFQIAPFLLMPFVENAFKHVSHFGDSRNWITIGLKVYDNRLLLDVSNSKPELVVKNAIESSGIGLANVRRRLDLLYPNSHKLKVLKSIKDYRISLEITLERHVSENSKIA